MVTIVLLDYRQSFAADDFLAAAGLARPMNVNRTLVPAGHAAEVFGLEHLISGWEKQRKQRNQTIRARSISESAASSVTFRYSPVEEIDLCPRCWRTFSIPAFLMVCMAIECLRMCGWRFDL
jgi:hypothetical protein